MVVRGINEEELTGLIGVGIAIVSGLNSFSFSFSGFFFFDR